MSSARVALLSRRLKSGFSASALLFQQAPSVLRPSNRSATSGSGWKQAAFRRGMGKARASRREDIRKSYRAEYVIFGIEGRTVREPTAGAGRAHGTALSRCSHKRSWRRSAVICCPARSPSFRLTHPRIARRADRIGSLPGSAVSPARFQEGGKPPPVSYRTKPGGGGGGAPAGGGGISRDGTLGAGGGGGGGGGAGAV
jgi:hypothetical protein